MTTTPTLSDHPRIPSKSSSFPDDQLSDDQLSDHPSESSSSAFSAMSASDFNHRALLSAVERLHPALDELRAWQQAWQPVIDRVQAQQRDSDLVLRDILSELRRLQSSRATQEQDLRALLSQTVAWQQQSEPVIDRLQIQQRDSDLVVRTILSQLHRLQSSRATPNADRRRRLCGSDARTGNHAAAHSKVQVQ